MGLSRTVFRDKQRFRSKITIFPPRVFSALTELVALEFCNGGVAQKTRMSILPQRQKRDTICVTLTFYLESGVRVTCDVGYHCANFSLPKPLCSRLRPDVCDRQMSDSIIA